MHSRQELVQEWKATLALNTRDGGSCRLRFSWFRQIYSRVYRFLLSHYGDGEWRDARGDSNGSNASSTSESRMPFVDHCSTTTGLRPKSADRIRATLDSIHDSNPGIAVPGTTTGVDGDTWVVVAAHRSRKAANLSHHRLILCGIEARIQNRTTDVAVAVPHKEFSAALYAIRHVAMANRIWIRRRVDLTCIVGVTLFAVVILTGLMCAVVWEGVQHAAVIFLVLSFAAFASIWLCLAGRNRP